MALYLVDPPTDDVVSLEDAKAHLRISHSDDDDLIAAICAAATKHAENVMQRALQPQTWEYRIDWFPCALDWRCRSSLRYDDIVLPLAPLIGVNSVKYRDTNGDEQTASSSIYHVIGVTGERGRIALRSGQSWPAIHSEWPEGVIVNFDVGYEDIDIPTPIVQAVKLLISQFYEHREEFVVGQGASKLPTAVEALLFPYRSFA